MALELKDGWIGTIIDTGRDTSKGQAGEVAVNLAVGETTIEESPNGKAINVKVKPENAKYGLSGYVGKSYDLAKVATEAVEKGVKLLYRFEQRRKPHLDVNIPMAELKPDLQSGKENTLKVLAGIYNFNTGEWLLSNDITAHPDNDPQQLKAFIESCVAKDIASFFEAPKEIVTDDNYKAKQHLLEIFSFLQGKENELGFELSMKERLIASTQLLKLIAKVQLINTQQNEISYDSKTFEDAKKIIFNSLSASALTKEDLTTNLKETMTKQITSLSELMKQFGKFLEGNK